jgi:hypothetical protein
VARDEAQKSLLCVSIAAVRNNRERDVSLADPVLTIIRDALAALRPCATCVDVFINILIQGFCARGRASLESVLFSFSFQFERFSRMVARATIKSKIAASPVTSINGALAGNISSEENDDDD